MSVSGAVAAVSAVLAHKDEDDYAPLWVYLIAMLVVIALGGLLIWMGAQA